MAHFRTSVIADAAELAPRLRDADRRELKAGSGHEPLPGLLNAVMISRDCCNTIIDNDGQVAGMFGYTVDSPISAAVWMLGSDSIRSFARPFLRESREWIQEVQAQYPLLWNRVDARNGLHIRWLRYSGFQIVREIIWGRELRLFFEFARTQCANQ